MKVQAAVDKRPFDRMKLYKLGILQLFMYHFSSTLDAVMYGPDSGNADHQSSDANAQVGHGLAHHLQMDLLRAHLRLSLPDLQDRKIKKKHDDVNLLVKWR